MKEIIILAYAILIGGALCASSSAQEAPAAPAQVSPAAPAATPAAPVKKKTAKKKRAKTAPKAPAAAAAVPVSPEPVQVSTPAAEVPPAKVDVATAEPAAAAEAAPAAPPPSVCPHCFQPLLAGYKGILSDLDPWMREMDARAAALDQKLSAIQKQINGKDDAIEQAKLGTDKKAMKAAVKSLAKEHKLLMKDYSAASDEKDEFYETFSKEIEKKARGYNKIIESKLGETLSAASQ